MRPDLKTLGGARRHPYCARCYREALRQCPLSADERVVKPVPGEVCEECGPVVVEEGGCEVVRLARELVQLDPDAVVPLALSERRPAMRGNRTAAESDLRAEAAAFVASETARVCPPEGAEASPVERLRLAGSILHQEVHRLPPEQAEILANLVGALVDLCEAVGVARG